MNLVNFWLCLPCSSYVVLHPVGEDSASTEVAYSYRFVLLHGAALLLLLPAILLSVITFKMDYN